MPTIETPIGPRAAVNVCLLLLAAQAFVPSSLPGQVGVLGGSQRDDLRGLMPDPGFGITDDTNDFHLGVFLDLDLGRAGIRPAVVFHRISDFTFATSDQELSFDLDMVEVPLDLRLELPIPVLAPYLVAGPALLFPSSSDDRIDERLASTPLRLDVGVGIQLRVGLRLWPEVRYGRGLTNFFESVDVPIGDQVFSAEGDARLDTLMFRLGISF